MKDLYIKHYKQSIGGREFQAGESKISLGITERSILNQQSRDTGATGHKPQNESKHIKKTQDRKQNKMNNTDSTYKSGASPYARE
jgi:hypothetical protein